MFNTVFNGRRVSGGDRTQIDNAMALDKFIESLDIVCRFHFYLCLLSIVDYSGSQPCCRGTLGCRK